MAMGCGAKCAKFILIVFNALFWLSGAAVLGVGIWLLVDPALVQYQEVIAIDTSDPYLKYAAYFLIAAGSFVFLVGFCGCCGALRESKCMLGVYIFCMVLIMAVELAAGIVAVIYKDKVMEELKGYAKNTLERKYMSKSNETSDTLSTAWDFVQFEFQCCGVDNPGDYSTSLFKNETGNPVPRTCCKLEGGQEADFEISVPVNWNTCKAEANGNYLEDKTQLNKEGCYNSIKSWFESHIVVIIGVGIGIAAIELFGFIFAICLCRNVGEED